MQHVNKQAEIMKIRNKKKPPLPVNNNKYKRCPSTHGLSCLRLEILIIRYINKAEVRIDIPPMTTINNSKQIK